MRRSNGMARSRRFSLLLLDDGEYLFEDFAITKKEITAGSQRGSGTETQGRLWVCSRGLYFEPKDVRAGAVLKFPYRQMERVPLQSRGSNKEFGFVCTAIKEMKREGMDQPYVTRNLDKPLEQVFTLLHTDLDHVLPLLGTLYAAASQSRYPGDESERRLLTPVLEERMLRVSFDKSRLVDFRETVLSSGRVLVDRIEPLVNVPGCLVLTSKRLYFQPAEINNIGEACSSHQLSTVRAVFRRRYLMRQCGLELLLSGREGGSLFFSFHAGEDERDSFWRLLQRTLGESHGLPSPEEMLSRWQRREVDNFEYLRYLNALGDRSTNDLTQYPVFPWVLADYESRSLDLNKAGTFRDLSQPIGALNAERLESFQQRFKDMPRPTTSLGPSGTDRDGIFPPFLYGTHYSTPGYVLFFLVRQQPDLMLRLQNGKFDVPERLFNSMNSTWQSVLGNQADLKELIPEFYDSNDPAAGEFLVNMQQLELGRLQNGKRVGDVELPKWARNPEDFVRQCRAALESEHVSSQLHRWIDLIFGCKQRGKEAEEANNVFYYMTYEGAVNVEAITDTSERRSLEAQVREFGQCPKQLFLAPHPGRNDTSGATVELSAPLRARQTAEANTVPTSTDVDSVSAPERSMEPARNVAAASEKPAKPSIGAGVVPAQHRASLVDLPPPSYHDVPASSSVWPRGGRGGVAAKAASAAASASATASSFWRRTFGNVPEPNAASPPPWRQTSGAPVGDLDCRVSTATPPIVRLTTNEMGGHKIDAGPATNVKADLPLTEPVVGEDSVTQYDTVPPPSNRVVAAASSCWRSSNGGGVRWTHDLAELQISEVTIVKGHRAEVSALRFSEDSVALYSTSHDRSLAIYSLETTKVTRRATLGKTMALSACCPLRSDTARGGKMLVVGSWSNAISLYSVTTGRVVSAIRAHDDAVASVAVAGFGEGGDGITRFVASGSWDSTVKLWQCTPSGFDETPLLEIFDHSMEVHAVSLDMTGNMLVSAAADGTVLLHDSRTEANEPVWRADSMFGTGDSAVQGVDFAADGRNVIACLEGRMMLFDTRSTLSTDLKLGHPAKMRCFQTDSRGIVASFADDWRIFAGSLREPLSELVCIGNAAGKRSTPPTCCAVHPSGKLLAVGAKDGEIRICKLSS